MPESLQELDLARVMRVVRSNAIDQLRACQAVFAVGLSQIGTHRPLTATNEKKHRFTTKQQDRLGNLPGTTPNYSRWSNSADHC